MRLLHMRKKYKHLTSSTKLVNEVYLRSQSRQISYFYFILMVSHFPILALPPVKIQFTEL
jgi:hypothetical protein